MWRRLVRWLRMVMRACSLLKICLLSSREMWPTDLRSLMGVMRRGAELRLAFILMFYLGARTTELSTLRTLMT